jgi:uncharacterized protein (TIGR00251 family)
LRSPSDPASPVTARADGVLLAVRVVPKAARSRVLGRVTEADGRTALKLALAAPPQEGRANAALIDLLAAALGLPRRDLALIAGTASRRKTVAIRGDASRLMAQLDALCGPG